MEKNLEDVFRQNRKNPQCFHQFRCQELGWLNKSWIELQFELR
jgi:hypothetical protein